MTTEIYWLTMTALLTGLMWAPYVLNRVAVRGLGPAMGNPGPDDAPHAPWAERAILAHRNSVENLVVFAVVVFAAHAADVSTALTAGAAMVCFFARLAHYVVYTLGVPVARTLAYVAAAVSQLLIGLSALGMV